MATTIEERKKRDRAYWEVRKNESNARRRAIYFKKTLPEREAKLKERALDAEVDGRVPREKVNSKSNEEKRRFILEAKSTPCADCGGVFHAWAMEFDHRVPELKAFSIARCAHRGSFSFARIKEELAKCDVVCANCHRVRTARRSQGLPPTLPPPEYHI